MSLHLAEELLIFRFGGSSTARGSWFIIMGGEGHNLLRLHHRLGGIGTSSGPITGIHHIAGRLRLHIGEGEEGVVVGAFAVPAVDAHLDGVARREVTEDCLLYTSPSPRD